jgi:outer membrane protein OmpA-like peptidoglycan-associated protein
MSRQSKQATQIKKLRQSGVSLSRAAIYATGSRRRSKARLAGFAVVIFGGFIAAGYGLIAVTQAAAVGQSAPQQVAVATPIESTQVTQVAPPTGQTADLLAAVTRSSTTPALAPIIAPVSAPDCVTPLAAKATALTISFASGAATLPPDQLTALEQLVAAISACPAAHVIIAGHSDATGADYGNMLLSWQRAEAVAAAVASLTDDTSQFETVGYGSREPLLDADGIASEADSRRVELRVLRAPVLAIAETGE